MFLCRGRRLLVEFGRLETDDARRLLDGALAFGILAVQLDRALRTVEVGQVGAAEKHHLVLGHAVAAGGDRILSKLVAQFASLGAHFGRVGADDDAACARAAHEQMLVQAFVQAQHLLSM